MGPLAGTLGVFSIGTAVLALWIAIGDWRLLLISVALFLVSAALALVLALLRGAALELGKYGELLDEGDHVERLEPKFPHG